MTYLPIYLLIHLRAYILPYWLAALIGCAVLRNQHPFLILCWLEDLRYREPRTRGASRGGVALGSSADVCSKWGAGPPDPILPSRSRSRIHWLTDALIHLLAACLTSCCLLANLHTHSLRCWSAHLLIYIYLVTELFFGTWLPTYLFLHFLA